MTLDFADFLGVTQKAQAIKKKMYTRPNQNLNLSSNKGHYLHGERTTHTEWEKTLQIMCLMWG